MGQRTRNIPAILLKCAVISFATGGQQVAAAGTAAPAMPVTTASVKPILVASASQAISDEMMAVQETKNAEASAEPSMSALERKSFTPLPSRKQRRRKPKMAGIPAGLQAVTEATKGPVSQVAAQEIIKNDLSIKPQAAVQKGGETEDPFASARPKPQVAVQKDETQDPFAPAKPKPQAAAQKTEGAEDLFASAKPKPQIAAQKDENEDPFAPAKPKPQAAVRKDEGSDNPFALAKSETDTQEKVSGKRYGMAPIRWGARVTETVGWSNESDTAPGLNGSTISTTNLYNIQSAEVNLSSYVLQSYIAQVGGKIGVMSDSNRIRSNGSTYEGKSTTNSLYGNGTLAMFSRSRFPFNLGFGINDNRTATDFSKDSIVVKTLDVRQAYTPKFGPSRYNAGYNRIATNTTVSPGDSTTNSVWDGNYTTKLGSAQEQPFNARVRHSEDAYSSGQKETVNMVTAKHTYLPPDSLLSLDTNANIILTKDSYQNSTSDQRFGLVNTTANWQPESEDIPLFVTGIGYIQRQQSATAGKVFTTQSASGSVLANYVESPNLTYSADGSVAQVSNSGRQEAPNTLSTTQGGRVSYRSDAVEFGEAAYLWSANGGVRNQTGITSTSSIFGGTGHSLAGPYLLSLFGNKTQLRYSVNQSLSAILDRSTGPSETLINGGAVSWAGPRSETLSEVATMSVTDTRTMGNNPSHTLVVDIGLGGQGRKGYGYSTSIYGVMIDSRASLDAVYSQRRNQYGAQAGQWLITPSATGSATYKKGGVFGVRGLAYLGRLEADVLPNQQLKNMNEAERNTWRLTNQWKMVSYRFNQSLTYRIGQNEVRLTGKLNEEHSGAKNASILLVFKAWRSIGN